MANHPYNNSSSDRSENLNPYSQAWTNSFVGCLLRSVADLISHVESKPRSSLWGTVLCTDVFPIVPCERLLGNSSQRMFASLFYDLDAYFIKSLFRFLTNPAHLFRGLLSHPSIFTLRSLISVLRLPCLTVRSRPIRAKVAVTIEMIRPSLALKPPLTGFFSPLMFSTPYNDKQPKSDAIGHDSSARSYLSTLPMVSALAFSITSLR